MTSNFSIDDDAQFRAMLTQMIILDARQVTIACDGEEKLRLPGQVKPELVVTDITLPNIDGMETIMARRSEGGSASPITAVSGGGRVLSAQFKLETALLMGVKATLDKPFAWADLHRAIEQALS